MNGRASGPVLTSLFLFVPDQSASSSLEKTYHACAGSRSDYQIAYSAATARLRNARSDTKISGHFGGFDGGCLKGRNGFHSAAATALASDKAYFGRMNGAVSSSHCDIATEGVDKTNIDDIDKRLSQVRMDE